MKLSQANCSTKLGLKTREIKKPISNQFRKIGRDLKTRGKSLVLLIILFKILVEKQIKRFVIREWFSFHR